MKTKRVLSLILAGVIAVTSIGANGITSFATERESIEESAESENYENEIYEETFDSSDSESDQIEIIEPEAGNTNGTVLDDIASGKCGDNVTWKLFGGKNDLTLAFYGSGDTYNDLSGYEWSNYKTEITKVKVDHGITSIGASAFSGFTNLKTVDIANTVELIWNDVFFGCSSLESIEIPNSVTTIGSNCFYQCTSLKTVKLPDSVDYIGCFSFYLCGSLEHIEIPEKVTLIEGYLFARCNNLISVKLPAGLKTIGYRAFQNCSKLSQIDIPDSVTYIDMQAFEGCMSLSSITIPSKVDIISECTFHGCVSLKSISIKGSIKEIEKQAFLECSSLSSISLPNSLNTIGYAAFGACDNLKSITIPNSVTSIEGYAFSGCDKLESLVIPASVTTLGDGIVSESESLKSIEILSPITGTGAGLCMRCPNLVSVKLPKTLTSIDKYAFYGCTSLGSIKIPDSVKTIYESAFKDCSALKNVAMPSSLKTIDFEAFSGCTGLIDIRIPVSVTEIGEAAFIGCSNLEEAVILGSLTSISERTFKNCTNLSTVKIPGSVMSIGKSAFSECSKISDVYYEGTKEDFSKIRIGEDNSFLTGAKSFHDNWDSGIDARPVYIIEATAYGNGTITPSGRVKVHEHMSQEYTITPEKGYQVEWYSINGKKTKGSISNYKFKDVTENCTIEVSFVLKHQYKDKFKFSLSSPDTWETAEYDFSFDFDDFFKSAYDHNNQESMLRMSMKVAMAAMDPNMFTGTSLRATYIKDLMDKLDFHYSEKDINYENPNGNTIGTAIGSRTIKKGDEEYTLILVAVRGGGYKSEWAGNCNVGNGEKGYVTLNHNGFNIASDTVIGRIRQYLEDDNNGISDYSKVKVWITGYSRAAAVSNLTAAKLDDGAIEGISPDNVYAFCYECPKNTQLTEWNAERYDNIISVVNLVDFIPLVAPCRNNSAWNYHRCGITLYINDGNQSTEGFSADLEKMRQEYRAILGNAYDPTRLNGQLECYLKQDNLTINSKNRHFVEELTGLINTPQEYLGDYQNKIYKEIMKAGDLANLDLTKFLTLLFPALFDLHNECAVNAYMQKDRISEYVEINHYPELALAWIDTMNMDDYLRLSDLNNHKTVVINCPVDVTVYDSKGNIAGQIINNEPVLSKGGVGAYIDENGQKTIVLPSDGNYRIETTAYEDGEVSITTLDYYGEDVSSDSVESYLNISVKKNDTITATTSGTDIKVKNSKGQTISPDVSQSGAEIVEYKVEVQAEGPGTVEGGGFYYAGEFCQGTAIAQEECRFLGWYDNDVLVSTESVYRFAVLSDTSIKAVFKEFPEDAFTVQYTDTTDDPYEGLCYDPENGHFEVVYTGKAAKPAIRVIGAKGALSEGVDYTIKYSNNLNYNAKGKPATITVTGKGDFTGKKVMQFYILPADLGVAKEKGLLTVSDEIKIQSGKKASPSITYRDYTLKASDMILSNRKAISEDTAIDITGKGNFTGKIENIKVKVLKADEVKNYTIKAELKVNKHIYNDKEHELSCSTPDSFGELTVTAGSSKTPLIKDTDYTVTYSSNVNAGTASVKIKGIEPYIGTVIKTFKIQPDNASVITAELADPDAITFYDNSGVRPEIKVTLTRPDGESKELSRNKDYTVTYSNNKKAGNGKFNVSFIGNYKGHEAIKNKSFTISPASFKEAKANSADMVYTKPGKYISAPMVSINGTLLSTKDYSVKYYDGDTELDGKSKLTLDDNVMSKEITVKITGRGNYLEQEIITTYHVLKMNASMTDLSKVRIVAKQKDSNGKDVAVGKKEYTGKGIRPAVRVLIKSEKTWMEVPSSYYSVNYVNNIKRGKATIIITGDGINTIGTKKATFTIGTNNLGLFRWLFG